MSASLIPNGISLEWLNSQVRRAGFTPSACGWQDSTGHVYVCSIESTPIGDCGSHPAFEASFNPGTRWLEIGKEKWLVASDLTMGWIKQNKTFPIILNRSL